MSDEFSHLTEEQRKSVLDIYPKEESTDEGVKEDGKPVIKPEVDKLAYTEFEKKTKTSDRIQFEDSEIEIIEEEFD